MKSLGMSALCALALVLPARSATAQVAGETTLGVTVEELKLVVLGWSVKKDMLDKHVYNEARDDIGEVQDVVVTPKKEVSWAILSIGGFLGIADKLVAIPMDQLTFTNGRFVLKGATKAALKAMPEFRYRTAT